MENTSKSTRDLLKKQKESLNGQVKAQILIPLRHCSVTWNRVYMGETPQTSHCWKNSTLRSAANIPQTMDNTSYQGLIKNWLFDGVS